MRADLAASDHADARFAAARLGLGALALALAIGAFGWQRWSGWWLLVPGLAFAATAVAHARLLERQTHSRRRLAHTDRALARLEDRWQGLGVTGAVHLPTGHPYAEDLDLFGAGGLFDLVCTTRTDAGERRLAAWLLAPAPPGEVHARQEAVRDLAARDAFREDLAVLGPDVPGAATTDAVTAWAAAAGRPPASWAPVVLVALSLVTLAALAIWARTSTPPDWFSGALAAQAVVGFWLRPRVRRSIRAVEDRAHDLRIAAALVARVEAEPFTSPRLRELQARLHASGAPASAEIRRLSRLVDLLTSRQNQIFGPLSVLLFWATHLAWAVDRWRARAGRHVGGWFDALGEVEALSALATFAGEHPDAVYPELGGGPPMLHGTAVAHPLLPAAIAVGNDVALGGDAPHLVIVSGSNMSGKSTYMRAIGVNVVLAQAGAPVCAAALRLTPLMPAGTLRVQDSLQSGQSRFFAEITKLRQIVDLARQTSGAGTLFLIDELLSGTNSHDRQQGAAGVLRGLVDLGAIGLATTHDLALTAFAGTLGARARNMHFVDHFEDGVLRFDYRLRDGVVSTSNAIALMRSVGLDV
ncbi:MAG: DNA mismatch repair protein MutS [Acidobacteria bacterium]|nr:DNA mismatch repair protein MutS [Acidobacteriota bacterium]